MDAVSIIALGISAVRAGIEYVEKLRAAARQTGELTPEQDAAFAKELADMRKDPAWASHQKGYGYGYGYGKG